MATRTIDTDICLIGSGITAAQMALKLCSERRAKVTVIEAGAPTIPSTGRSRTRARGRRTARTPGLTTIRGPEHPRHAVRLLPSMVVGGLATLWGGTTRYSPEDFRLNSLYGVGDDWPFSYEDLDPFYQEAEEGIGICGEQGPPELDPRGKPFPMPAIPLTYNLLLLREWAAKAGIPMWSQPSAKTTVPYKGRGVCCRLDTCVPICPIGARYSPDLTYDALVKDGRMELVTGLLIRRLHADDSTGRITHATGNSTERAQDEVRVNAKTFVLTGGFVWSPHLLLLSTSAKYPNGLANRSGLVGKYLCGHRNVSAQVKLPLQLYPGMNVHLSLVTKKFMRPGKLARYIRHDLRIWESSYGQEPRLGDERGAPLLGDALLSDWRERVKTGVARVRAYYDVLPARRQRARARPSRKNRWATPCPPPVPRCAESLALRAWTEETIRQLFSEMARVGNGEVISRSRPRRLSAGTSGGGCRMGNDPARSVVDSWGRTHDHENLFVAGAPTCVSASCCNGTLTFAALGCNGGEDR
jgi:quinoprotein glucose dehydrogenase